MGFLMAAHPGVMIFGMILGLAGRVSHVLAFLLPLKVILLAGSEGVPSYFRPLIDDSQKALAVVALSLGAIFCYVLSLFFDGLTKRLSVHGGERLSELPDSANAARSDETSSNLLQVMQLLSNLLFVMVILMVLAWIAPILLACVLVAMAGSIGFLTRSRDSSAGPGANPGIQDINDTLNTLAALTFFVCFGVILLPFVLSDPDASVLVAIISFVLLRQLLNTLPKMVRDAIRLVAKRPLVNALVFRDQHLQQEENEDGRSVHRVFEREAHLARIRTALAGEIAADAELDVCWIDSPTGNLQMFEIRARDSRSPAPRLYFETATRRGRGGIAEEVQPPLDDISMEELGAPPLVARFPAGPYECLVSKIGEIAPEPAAQATLRGDLLARLWSLEPPAATRAHCAVRSPLPDRLTQSLVERVSVAVDTEEERRIFRLFEHKLPCLHSHLRRIPLYIHNRQFPPGRIYLRADGRPVLSNQGRWSLEPIGLIMPPVPTSAEIRLRLEHARQRRPSIPSWVAYEDLTLVNIAARLEAQIGRALFKQALHTMSKIIEAGPLNTTASPQETRQESKSPPPTRQSAHHLHDSAGADNVSSAGRHRA